MPQDNDRNRELEELRRRAREKTPESGGGDLNVSEYKVIGDKRIAKSTIDEAEQGEKSARKKLNDLMTTLDINIGRQARERKVDPGPPRWADGEEQKQKQLDEMAALREEARKAREAKAAQKAASEVSASKAETAPPADPFAADAQREQNIERAHAAPESETGAAFASGLDGMRSSRPASAHAEHTSAQRLAEEIKRAQTEDAHAGRAAESADKEAPDEALSSKPASAHAEHVEAAKQLDKGETAEFNRRSIIKTIQMDKQASLDGVDPINKDMLAPTIERGVSFSTSEISFEEEESAETPASAPSDYAAKHPVFTETPAVKKVIPDEGERTRTETLELERTTVVSGGTATFETTAKRIEKKGLLNVKDNVDDSFREFFGDTVIIDRESLGEKAGRQRKIKDFVLSDGKSGAGGPVFEDDEPEENGGIDYRSDEDTEPVLKELTANRAKAMLRCVVTGVFALVLCAINLLAEFRMLPAALNVSTVFYLLNAALLLGAIAINIKDVISGLGKLFTLKATGVGVVAFSALLALIESLVMLVFYRAEAVTGVCSFIAASALFVCALGELLDSGRILDCFRTVSENYEKYASSVLSDEAFTRRLARELEVGRPSVLLKRKTGFTDNFLQHSYSKPAAGKGVATAALVTALLSVVGGGAAGYFLGDFTLGVRYAAAAAAFCSPFIATMCVELPIFSMQKYLSKYSAVVPGYSAAAEVCSANCVVLEGRELFPKGNVMLHGIKTFERERIDKAILYAASVLIQSCDTMAHVFMNVIQGKTEMLYRVDSVEYEGSRGFSFWIDKTRLLLGTRELLTAHEIEVPSRDYENRYTKTSTRDAVYLAVAGKLYAMFVLSYSPNAEVESALHSFEREGVSILVHTRDFNLTPDKISSVYHIPRRMISVVREGDIAALTEKTEYVSHAPSSLTHIGSLTSFVKGIIACYNVRSSAKLAYTVELASIVLGAAVAVALALTGALATIGVLSALMYQVICTLLLIIVVAAHRY